MTTSSTKGYDRVANVFDFLRGGDMKRWCAPQTRLFENMNGKVLYVGAGTGQEIVNFPPGLNITAIDLSLKMLEKEGSNLYENMTKKETQMLNREKVKLADQHRGIKDMKRLPDALIVVDAQYEDTAIREAKRLEIPVVAIVDSNTNPKKVDYPIPANDDSMRTIQLIISALADSVLNASGKSSEEETRTDETETKDSVQKTTVRNLSEKDQQSSNEELDDVKQEEE